MIGTSFWSAVGWALVIVWGGSVGLFLVGLAFDWIRFVERIPTRELAPELRRKLATLPNWCAQCDLTELVCDVHPRTPFERCGCPDGVPRSCPGCQDYDVTALLEEIASLRHRLSTRGQTNGKGS